MCHHWVDDRDAVWERASEELAEEDPETAEPEREHVEHDEYDERVEAPTADDD